jgi:DNA-binding MarR family transcriptional regulator
MRGMAELFRTVGLSPTQYNALRILRGAGEPGLTCGEIASRLITADPDVTRLLDRLEKAQLIARVRSTEDRRVVRARITPAGLEALAGLDGPVAALHVRQLGHMGRERLATLIELLESARRPGG